MNRTIPEIAGPALTVTKDVAVKQLRERFAAFILAMDNAPAMLRKPANVEWLLSLAETAFGWPLPSTLDLHRGEAEGKLHSLLRFGWGETHLFRKC